MRMWRVVFVFCICLAISVFCDSIPEQVHIAYGANVDEMTVTWATRDQSSSVVRYGFSATDMPYLSNGTCTEWTKGNLLGLHYVHKVKLTGLIPGKTYYYFVISDAAQSKTFHFTSMQNGTNWKPKFLVFGDMGRHGGAQALDSLIQQVINGYPTAAIHVGDFAYDLSSNYGINGDEFMNRIEPIAAYIPYMTCVGNHEDDHEFSHYRNRFYMPGDTENMWFSWNIANVHFISYSTEVYFTTSIQFSAAKQYAWLQADLQQANKERNIRPWVIAYGHRPFYCSNTDHDDCTKLKGVVRTHLEQLFFENGVDLIIEAHEHSYERLWPVYNEKVYQTNYLNPKAPVHLISGAAGCNEDDGTCVNPIQGPLGPWSAFRSSGNHTYGYGRLEIHNDTHIYWEELLALENDKILDSIWIEQHQHGPFHFR